MGCCPDPEPAPEPNPTAPDRWDAALRQRCARDRPDLQPAAGEAVHRHPPRAQYSGHSGHSGHSGGTLGRSCSRHSPRTSRSARCSASHCSSSPPSSPTLAPTETRDRPPQLSNPSLRGLPLQLRAAVNHPEQYASRCNRCNRCNHIPWQEPPSPPARCAGYSTCGSTSRRSCSRSRRFRHSWSSASCSPSPSGVSAPSAA